MLIKRFLTTMSGLLVAAAAASVVATPAAAQGGVELVPWAGVYIPTSNSVGSLGQDLSRDVSVVGGARLTFWGTGMLGLEATGGYAPAKIADATINEKSNMLVASGRLLLALSPVTNKVGFFIAGGPAVIVRGKNPFDNNKSSTDFGANVGAGFRFGLGQSNATALRLDLEDYMYNGDFGGGNKFQHDLVASLGLAIPIGGHHSNNGSQ